MNKAKKIRAGKYMYRGCAVEKSSIEKCWFATNSAKGILIKCANFKAAKTAVDNIPA